ncbi:hypothetical protein SDC9_137568 [bioreactor metagenome]|uniref:Uncharacterized protein n=1 Tax=bioreactor metagenome TaxID=1076179 RepID=A0A645DMC4_9ZZZZ
MERRRHRQRQRALGACSLEHFAALFHADLGAGDHGLRRVVEVHRFHDFLGTRTKAGRGFGTASHHLGGIQPQDRGHRARTHRHGLLHGCSTQAHQRRSLCQRQHARGHQR